MLVFADRVCDTTDTTGTGALTLNDAPPAGFQGFASGVGDANACLYNVSRGTQWESGVGVYEHATRTLARERVLASSASGAAVDFSSGRKTVILTPPAELFADLARALPAPGGRLTLGPGEPVPTSDLLAADTVFYTPFVHDVLPLWDGRRLRPMSIAGEPTLDVSGVDGGTACDVFARIDAGAVTLDCLPWTDPATRATGLSWLNGIRCKAGDPTRRYLGSFFANDGGTTESSLENRYLWNVDNQVPLTLTHDDSAASHTYNTGTFREWGGGTHRVRWLCGLASAVQLAMLSRCSNGYGSGTRGLSIDAVGSHTFPFSTTVIGGAAACGTILCAPGTHYAAAVEYNSGSADYLHISGAVMG